MIDNIERAKNELRYEYRKNPWACTDHGRKLLSSNDELNAYLCAYGEMHKCKCLAALQNFPYNRLPSTFEIVDWGCGQGVGTICMMDCLYERKLLNRLKRVTLIEPSSASLNRAFENVSNALQGWNVNIQPILKFLPANDVNDLQLTELGLTLPGTIHLFSNILDIASISLKRTAEIIAKGRGCQFVICAGPVNDNSPRIDEFSEYFVNKTVFSDIYDKRYGFTSDTYHPFSCKTKCFFFENVTNDVAVVVEGHYSDGGAYDDYDLDGLIKNGSVSKNVLKVYRKLSSVSSSQDKIFLKPDLNGDKPDIVLVRPGKGIVILNVFDGSIGDMSNPQNLLSRVYSYRTNLIQQHSVYLLQAALADKSGWYTVRPAVWFADSSRSSIDSVYSSDGKDNDKQHIISGVVTLSMEDFDGDDILGILDVKYNRRAFSRKASDEIIRMLTMQWHSFKDGDSGIILTKRQKELARSYEGRHIRIKGVAGSGKTQILCSSAVMSQLRTGGDVLILTFNITLVNYIRYRMSQVPADFPWNKFKITNYHRFITMQAKGFNKKPEENPCDELTFWEDKREAFPKFSAIFIDEAQDYQYDWYKILYDNFLSVGGEFVIFGDEKQDIYHRRTFNVVPNLGKKEWGAWNKLTKCRRQNNPYISDLANRFQSTFFESSDELVQEDGMLAFDSNIPSYVKLHSDTDSNVVAQHISEYMATTGIEGKDTVVLSQRIELLRNIAYSYEKLTGNECKTVFETKGEYDSISKQNKNRLEESVNEIRTNRKPHFTMSSPQLKISTICSYKGWEAENVILVIQSVSKEDTDTDNCSELIYTALTRAKKNLFIINLGNEKYHHFFETNL